MNIGRVLDLIFALTAFCYAMYCWKHVDLVHATFFISMATYCKTLTFVKKDG